MTIRVLLPFIAATFVCSGSVIAEALQPKTTVSVTQKKPGVAAKKPTVVKVVQPKWKTFTAPDGRFSVLMPGRPKRETQTQKTYMGEINLQVFAAQPPKQDVAYIVTYNDFPYNYAQMATPQEILNKAQYTAVTTTKSNLVSERNIRSSNGHPGKEIEYVNAGGKITRSRMYFADGYLYQVTAITSKKQDKTLAKTITGYLNSFQIVLKR
ncbi:hypothetical protein Cylst_5893 [Cylindrospermum stagnale PCC 7417]|uniref:PsbP n=1 Tax=Cylindrospermum stagnale PCC 7417 TaxID=56107 RepID=K9X716_9NOST|nr:hypothetical protein [Cylindrospermum stagnale]AFZ27871.1 hypothetical protein Cylst_5893 [Cylindrospermum stagnale PCC 7417]